MHVNTIYKRLEMGILIHFFFVFSPIIAVDPVGAKLFHVIQIGAVIPATISRHFMPWKFSHSPTDIFKSLFGYLYSKGFHI